MQRDEQQSVIAAFRSRLMPRRQAESSTAERHSILKVRLNNFVDSALRFLFGVFVGAAAGYGVHLLMRFSE